MKHLILTLLLTISSLSISQLAPPNDVKFDLHLDKMKVSSRKSYRMEPKLPIGIGMLLGGGAFMTAGLLTSPTYVGGSTTERKPFFQQPGMLPIVSGALLMTGGIVITLGR